MKNSVTQLGFILLLFVGLTACKSEFERIRTSGDSVEMLNKANSYFDEEEYLKAQSLYELIVGSYRGRPEAEQIAYRYAYTYYHLEQYILAAYYFKSFATTYGGSTLKQEAEFMEAYSNYQLSPTFRLDQSYSLKAIEGFQEFINRYPNNERVSECNRLIDEMRLKLEVKDYEAASLYFDLQQYQSAIRSFENLLIEYPETQRAEEVRYRIVRSAFLLAKNSFVEKQEERYNEVVKYAELFINRYAASDYAFDVQKMLNDSNQRLKQLKDV